MLLEPSHLEAISADFSKKIHDLRILYMSLVLQEEQAALHISQSGQVRSVFLDDSGRFLFGERFIGDPTFYTHVGVPECLEALLDTQGTLHEITRMLVLRLAAIHEDFYRALVHCFLRQQGNADEEKAARKYEMGPPESRLKKFQTLFQMDAGLTTEYQALNFLFRVRNCIAHMDGIVTEKFFEVHPSGEGNLSLYRTRSNPYGTRIELGQKIVLCEYDFSEMIHLVELVGKRVFSTILRESPFVRR